MTPVVEAIDLHRTYRTTTGTFRRRALEVAAVRGVSFEIGEGELFGLLGPNGAGKTTTIKMLITLLLPTSGAARVLGHDVVEDAQWVRKRIGYVFGGDLLFRGSVGRTDFPDGDFDSLRASIHDKLFTMRDDTIVLPGHGPATTVGREKQTNPFVGLPAGYVV